MSLFTSKRERRLWFWALAVILAICATLGLAGKLEAYLRYRNLLDTSFFVAFLLVGVTIAAVGLTKSPSGLEIWVAIGVAVVYVTVLFRVFVSPVERTDLFEYGLLAALIFEALTERVRNGCRVPQRQPFSLW